MQPILWQQFTEHDCVKNKSVSKVINKIGGLQLL